MNTCVAAYVLNIDDLVASLEQIFSKFLYLPKDVIFVKNYREPLYGTKKAILNKLPDEMIAHTPFHPFLCINFMKELLILKHYLRSDEPELFVRNLILDVSKAFIDETDLVISFTEKIEQYLNGEKSQMLVGLSMSEHFRLDCERILAIMSEIDKQLRHFTINHPNNIIAIDTESPMYVLKIYDEIKSFRYTEVVNKFNE